MWMSGSGSSFSVSRRLELAGILLLSLGLSLVPLDLLSSLPFCPFRYFLDSPCPTCGTTRSFQSILRGDLKLAWMLNPIGFIVALVIIRRLLFLVRINQIMPVNIYYKPFDIALLGFFFVAGYARYFGLI